MKPTTKLHELGQSLWLDNITRAMLDSGQLQRYIDEFSVTGLTSNPTIFDKAIGSGAYDQEIRQQAAATENHETLFFDAGDRGPAAGGRHVRPRPRQDGGCRRLGLAGALAAVGV